VLTELGRSGAQCAQTLAVEVQQCPLRAEVGKELGEELARRKAEVVEVVEVVEEKEEEEEEKKEEEKNNSDKI